MPSITGIDLGPDSCVLVRARPNRGGAEVSSLHFIERGAWAADRAGVAMELRALRRAKGFSRRARVVAWALSEPTRQSDPAVRSLLKPILAAGFRVQHVFTAPEALAEIARARPRNPGATAVWMAINIHGAAIAIVRDGELLFGRTFAWKYSADVVGPRAELLQRYSLVTHLAPEVLRGIAFVRSSYGANVETAITCGDLPDLRSLTMPLIEELDLEVETLDSTEGLHVVGGVPSGRFAECTPALRLATAAAVARLRVRRRTPSLRASLQIAAAAAIVTATGWLAYQYSPYAPARPVDHRMTADSGQMPAPTSGTSPAAPTHVSTRGSSPNAVPPQTAPSSPSTVVSTPAAPVATAPSPARVDTQPQPQLPPPPAAAAVVAETPVARLATPPAPLHAAPHADPPATESVPVRADRSPRRPVPLKDAVPSVDSILVSQERRLAIVEARVVSVGDRVGPRVVVEIERDAVVLQEPSGHQIRIPLRGERVVR